MKRVDVVELGLTDIDVDTAEDVDRCCDCLPVERYIVGDVEIQILFRLYACSDHPSHMPR